MAKLLDVNADELYTAAGKVDPDIQAYIRRIEALPRFLKAARRAGYGQKDFEKLIGKLPRKRPRRKKRS
jgi:hypothetical protein